MVSANGPQLACVYDWIHKGPNRFIRAFVFSRSLRPWSVDNVVDDAVLLRLCRSHDEIALHVPLNPLQRLASACAHQLVRDLTDAKNLSRMDVNICRLAAQPSHRGLMDQDAR